MGRKTYLFLILIFCPLAIIYSQTVDLGFTVYRGVALNRNAWGINFVSPNTVDPNYDFSRKVPTNSHLTGEDLTSAYARFYWLTPFNIRDINRPSNINLEDMWTALEGAVKQWTSGDSPETTVAVTLGEESSYDIGWDTYNNILFMDDFDAQGISAKALTLMYVEIDEYSTNQYHASMWETDIVLNNDQSSHTWNTNGNMDFASNLDLQSVITHEMGHAIGIGHSYLGKQFVNGIIHPTGNEVIPISDPNEWPTMWQNGIYTSQNNSFITLPTDQPRTIAQNDIDACIWIYNSTFNNDVFPTSQSRNDYKSAGYVLQDIRIPPNMCVQIRDGYELIMWGGFGEKLIVEEDACLEILPGGCLELVDVELVLDPFAACYVSPTGCLEASKETGCVFVSSHSEFTIKAGGEVVFNDNGFMIVEDGGTVILEDNAKLIFETDAQPFEIRPGAKFKLGKGAEIIVKGPIDAQGTAQNPITFESLYKFPTTDDYWKWLKLDGTQDGDPPPERILDHVVIEHADYGIYATYASNFNLTNSTVQNCLQNLYLSHSDAYIDGNVIANASGSAFNAHGIYLYSSSPSFYNNTISNNTVAGVYCYNYSSPEFGSSTSSTYGLNELNGNDHGIYANYYSNPFLGDTIPDTEGTYRLGGYNSIHDNASSAVKAVENCDIQAQYNWWGMYPVEAGIFDIEEGSTIDYANALTYDPVNDDPQSLTTGKINTTREMGSALMSGHQGFNPAGGENFTPRELLRLAKKLRIQQTPKLAIPVYKQLLTQYPNRVEARWGLIELISTFKEARLDSSVHFLRRLQNTHPSGKMIRIASDLLTVEHLQKKNASQAIANARQILTNYPNTESEKIALFDLLNIFLHFREDSLQAQGYLTQLEQKYPNDPLTWHGQMLLNSGRMSTPAGTMTGSSLAKGKATTSPEIPGKFEVFQNYPNPFNPATTIRFGLPEADQVRITVYTLTGQQVVTLMDDYLEEGFHEVSWNGKDAAGEAVASGIYIYYIKAGQHRLAKKMMLIK